MKRSNPPVDNGQKLEFGVIDQPNDPRFAEVYKCYLKCFTLKSEQESQANFHEILGRNNDPAFKAKAGEAREMWVYAKDPKSGEIVGAMNFDVFAGSKTPGLDGTVHGIYTLVDPKHRRQGVFDALIEQRDNAAKAFCRKVQPGVADPHIIIFAEQNAPLLMTGKEYLKDTRSAIDQCTRRSVFESRGFQTLGFRYIQPRLEADGEPCEYLDLVARGIPKVQKTLDPNIVKEHLSRFFALSFPEGTTLDHPDVAAMKHSLEQGPIPLFPFGRFDQLGQSVNVEAIKALPKAAQARPLYENFPRIAALHYGQPFKQLLPDAAQAFLGFGGEERNLGLHTSALNQGHGKPRAREAY